LNIGTWNNFSQESKNIDFFCSILYVYFCVFKSLISFRIIILSYEILANEFDSFNDCTKLTTVVMMLTMMIIARLACEPQGALLPHVGLTLCFGHVNHHSTMDKRVKFIPKRYSNVRFILHILHNTMMMMMMMRRWRGVNHTTSRSCTSIVNFETILSVNLILNFWNFQC
jgi:hypothetical protein